MLSNGSNANAGGEDNQGAGDGNTGAGANGGGSNNGGTRGRFQNRRPIVDINRRMNDARNASIMD